MNFNINIGKLINNILLILIFFLPFQVFTCNVFHVPSYIQIYYIFLITGLCFLGLRIITKKHIYVNKTILILYGIFFILSIVSSSYNFNKVFDINPYIYKLQVVTYTPLWDNPLIRTWYLGFFRTGLLFIFILIIYNFFNSNKNIEKVIKLFFILGFITTIYSIYQIISTKYGLPYGAIFSNRDESEVAQLFNIRRLDGVFFEPSPQAGFLSTIWCVALSQILGKNKQIILFSKRIMIIFLILSLVVMCLTFSPIGIFTPIIAMPLLLFYYYKNHIIKLFKRNYAFIIIIFTIFILTMSFLYIKYKNYNVLQNNNTIISYIIDKIQISTVELNDPIIYSNQDSRSVRNYAGIKMFQDNPILGIGPGNSGFFYFSYIPFVNFSKMSNLSPLINVYISLLGENGLLGFIVFLLLLLYPFYLAKTHKLLKYRSLIIGLLVAYFIILLITFFSYSYDKDPTFWIIYILLIKLILQNEYIKRNSK